MESTAIETPTHVFVIAKPIVHRDGSILAAGSKLEVVAYPPRSSTFIGICDNKDFVLCMEHGKFEPR